MRSLALLLLATVLALAGSGCATGSGVAASGLPVKRVVIYRNGVGYFEREGRVAGDQVQFQVRPTHIDDFLATLSVMEEGGSSVRSASFPMKVESAGTSEAPKTDARPMETVTLHLDGRSHDLTVGYVAEQPVWRPSYRLILEKGQLALQAWGIVQNLSGEEWHDVQMSLVAGAPIAFQSTLAQPVTPPRPVVTDTGELITAVPRGEATLAQEPAPPPAVAQELGMDLEVEEDESSFAKKSDAPRANKMLARMPAAPMASAPAMGRRGSSMPSERNKTLLASASVAAGTTRYDLPQPVTVPDRSATLVLLIAQPVSGEAVHMFAPDPGVPDSAQHPFRVARFKNTTDGLLERGPIAVVESGAFLGQGVLEPLSSGGEAIVPFALDRAVAVDSQRENRFVGARVAQIEAGNLFVERDQVTDTKYRVRNGGAGEVKVVVRHPRIEGTRLHQPPAGTDDQVGKSAALVPVTVKGRNTSELRVEERRAFTIATDWMSAEADEAMKAFFADPKSDRALVASLQKAWELRKLIEKDSDAREKLTAEKNILSQGAEETRENLRSLQRNPAKGVTQLREKLSARLLQMDSRLAELNRQLVELELRLRERQVGFRELVRELKLERSPTPAS